MECPNCKHATSNSALLQCSHCGEAFERGPLEEFQHLQYLANWLVHRPEITGDLKGQLLELVGRKQGALRSQLLPGVPDKLKPVEAKPARTPAVIEKKIVPEKPMPAAAIKTKAEIVSAPAPVVKSVPIPAPAPKPKPVPRKPAAPPKPPRPPIDWRKVIVDAATSGALLRALLYLGAFMIVVSATVLVIRFWDQFHPVVQLLFIASVPLSFYAGGWALRTRLKLVQAGTVLTGIGALLVIVDFAAIYQLGGIGQNNGPLYWLLVSIFCTALYTFTAWRLEGEFFDYLPLIGSASILFTLTRFLQLGIEWSVVSVTISGTLMTILASCYWKANGQWHNLARAARYLSQILIPLSAFYILFSPGTPPVGQMTGFLFAAGGYLVLAWQFPAFIFAYAALGASIGTVVFAMQVGNLPFEWYPLAASILALTYLFIGQRVQRSAIDINNIRKYVTALNTTGLIMLSLAAVVGFITSLSNEVWAGVIAMAFVSLDLVICAYLLKRSRYTGLAFGLFILPFSMAMIEWFDTLNMQIAPRITWITLAWSALALTYIGIGTVLQKTERHSRWLYGWAHVLTPIAVVFLPFSYIFDGRNWTSAPALLSLGMSISVYVISFILQDSRRHASLSIVSKWLPFGLGKSIFLWPIGFLLPIWCAILWFATDLSDPWFGAALAGIGLSYLVVGQVLFKRGKEYRLPFHVFTYLLCVLGILISASDLYSLFSALLITVISASLIAYLYNRVFETILASILFVWPFQLSLDIFEVPYYAQILGYALLASLAYIPIAIYLNKFQTSREKFHQVPFFSVGYALIVYAVIESLLMRDAKVYIPWVGMAVPLVATALFTFSASYFRASRLSSLWAWASILAFTVAFGQALTSFNMPAAYHAFAWVGLATIYVIVERTHCFTSQKQYNEKQTFWLHMFYLPTIVFALALAVLGLTLTLPETLNAFLQVPLKDYLPPILAQIAVVALALLSARLYKQHWQFFFEPFIAFLPATLFFIGYGEQIFGRVLTISQFALVWTVLGIIHVFAGAVVDRAKVRYAHGLYLGGYVLVSCAALWSMFEHSTLVWTLGLWIFTSIASALLVHFHWHKTWEEFLSLLFGTSKGIIRMIARNTFQWLAAWAFPIWCVIFWREISSSDSSFWLGLVIPPLFYLGLALWFRRVNSTYATPLMSAAHFYTIIGLLVSTPATINYLSNLSVDNDTISAFIILQAITVIFYAFSAWMSKGRGFAHASAWLSILTFSMAWKLYNAAFTPTILVIPWLIWSAILLLIGYTLDKNKVRYSHGPYLAGYVLMFYALAQSTEVRIINIYALAITIFLALLSYLIVHFGRHFAFEDFINSLWKSTDEITQQIVSTIFLFFASYAMPILLLQILERKGTPLAWQGGWLAIAAPLYIAMGLLVGKTKPKGTLKLVPTWALYSAGYALTAIGARFAFEDERLGTYILTLNVMVYAASAYIFRQVFWLYLSTVLTPIIALLVLHQLDRLELTWVAWTFIILAYLYLVIGLFFDRMKKRIASDARLFALPFYIPGFVLSILALAVASSEKTLAIQIYSAAVILYAISGWLFRETLFIYPAAWLAAVPYYLAIPLTPLEPRWYGLAWLPLIITYIAIARSFFHKEPLPMIRKDRFTLTDWIKHPATSFYLMAYALSLGMIWISSTDPLALTLALSAGVGLSMTSAYLFRAPAWIYPGLFAAHLALLSYFTIDPQGGQAYLLSYPFHVLTWLMALIGYGLSRWITVAGSRSERNDSDEDETHRFSWLDHVLEHPWARPFYPFAVIDIIVWQFVALNGYETTITLGIGHGILLALFSILWSQGSLVYWAISFSLLAVGASLNQAQVQFGDLAAVFGGIGFGLYLLARVIEPISSRFKPLNVWLTPLTRASILLTAAAVIGSLLFVEKQVTATAVSLAFAGALYITIAYRERRYPLGYLGMALLEIAWAILLYMNEIRQPQFYAIPGGLYFLGIAYLEMQRGRKKYAVAIEMLGLGVMLVTSFAQSLNGETGLVYFILLMIESLLVIGWGVLQKRKVPFFTGIAASAVNIAAQVIILISVHDIHRVNRWLVAFGAGLIITAIAVIAELKREQLRARSRQLGEMLETWE